MKQLIRYYTNAAILITNTLLLCACCNLALLAYGLVDSDRFSPPPPTIANSVPLEVFSLGALRYPFDNLQTVYYFRDDADIIWLLLETWNLTRICDPVTLFREGAYEGRFVNIHPAGFRYSDAQGTWEPSPNAHNVFVFGGSTTFGYGESDNLTIPSHLQGYLREIMQSDQVFVYNFGRAFYFSYQERLLFENLINQGIRPSLAIFIDGLNEFYNWDGQPADYSRCVKPDTVLDRLGYALSCQSSGLCLPAQVAADKLGDRLRQSVTPTPLFTQPTPPPGDDETTNQAIVDRWLENKGSIEQIATQYGIPTLFVMQPVPAYGYDLQNHLFVSDLADLGISARPHWGYQLWEARYADPTATWTKNVLNLTRLGEDNTGAIYLDGVHYTAGFMDEIAQAIAQYIGENPP